MQAGHLSPAVLLHGFGDSPECWSPMIADIVEDVEVTTPAAPGHAREPMPPDVSFTLAHLTEIATVHVEAAVRRADQPIVLGGHSMGASTAAAVAAARPDLVSGLYLEDPPWMWPPDVAVDPEVTVKTAELRAWISGLQGSSHDDRVQWCLDHNPGWARDEYDIWARAKAEVDLAVFDHPIDFQRYGWRPLADAIDVPVALLVGDWQHGSTCHPQVADDLDGRSGWRVIRVPKASHDVRRLHRGVAIEAFTALLEQGD